MTSVPRIGFLDRVASPFVRKATLFTTLVGGAIAGIDISNSNHQETAAIARGEKLDSDLLNQHRFSRQNLEVTQLRNDLNQEKETNQQAIIDASGKQEELNKRLAQLEEVRVELQERLEEAETSLSQAQGENADLRGEVDAAKTALALADQSIKDQEGTAKDLAAQIAGVKETQDKTITQELIISVIKSSVPSFVTISDKANPIVHGSGSIVKDNNGKYYILTCGHLARSYEELFNPRIVEGYEDAFKFEITPEPLPGGTVAWHSFKSGDVYFLPLNNEQMEIIIKGVKNKFGSEAEVGLSIKPYNEDVEPGQIVIGIGSPNRLHDSVKVTNVARVVNEKTMLDMIRPQHMYEISHGTTPGESGGPALEVNPRTRKGLILGLNTVTHNLNRSIGGGITNRQILMFAAADGIPLDSEENICSAHADAQFRGNAQGRNITDIKLAMKRRETAQATAPVLFGLLFAHGAIGSGVDDTTIEIFNSDIFNPKNAPLLAAPDIQGPKLEVPPLPEPVTPGPPPESLTPEPDSEFSKPYDTAPAPGDMAPAPGDKPMLQPLPELKKVPAPPVPIEE